MKFLTVLERYVSEMSKRGFFFLFFRRAISDCGPVLTQHWLPWLATNEVFRKGKIPLERASVFLSMDGSSLLASHRLQLCAHKECNQLDENQYVEAMDYRLHSGPGAFPWRDHRTVKLFFLMLVWNFLCSTL